MRLPAIEAPRAAELIESFAGVPILVVGDVMLDRFIVGRVTRISPEAPVPVVQFESDYVRLGGAANVANNIVSLGGHAALVGVVGTDAAAELLRNQLTAVGINVDGLVEDRNRPTTEKVRIVTGRNQQVARIDYERDTDVAGDLVRVLVARVKRLGAGAKALLVSDYLKGTITRTVTDALLHLARPEGDAAGSATPTIPLIVDPKNPHLPYYSGATLVTPNHHEAEIAAHCRIRTDEDARRAAHEFRRRANCASVLITRGEHGMWLSDPKSEGSVEAMTREVSDVTGAGDTVVATLALALAAGATTAEAAVLANHAAGIAVGKFGPAAVTPDELRASVGARE